MLVPPKNLNSQKLTNIIQKQYGVLGKSLEFFPLGEDSWSYRLGPLWISIRRDLRGHIPAAYKTALLLRDAGLKFVVAPLIGSDGRIIRRVDGLPVIVFPYRPSTPFSRIRSSQRQKALIVSMIGLVHNTNVKTELPTEKYDLPFDSDLENALFSADGHPVETGPFAVRFHRLIRIHRKRISAMRIEYHEIASKCSSMARPLVLTHGEPTAANILRYGHNLLLVDWGEAMWAPPERDWSHIIRAFGVAPFCDSMFLRLYDLRWILSEIAEYSTIFLAKHSGHQDDLAMWQRLVTYLPEVS